MGRFRQKTKPTVFGNPNSIILFSRVFLYASYKTAFDYFLSMNLATAFSTCAQKNSQKIAMSFGEREISYAELLAQSQKVAAHLQSNFGVKPGARVGIWLKNCPEFVVCVFGILQADAVVVPINNFLKPAEVNYILNDGGIDVLISSEELTVHFPELSAARPQ